MEVWIIIAVVVVLVLLFPLLRFLFKRFLLRQKLRRICKRQGCRMYGTRKLWWLAHRSGKNNDVIIETVDKIFSIKLFGTFRHASRLVFTQDGNYYVRHYLALFAYWQQATIHFDTKRKSLPQYDFSHELPLKSEKAVCPVLLLHPACMEVRREQVEVPLDNGDVVNGMMLFSLKGFLTHLQQ